MFGWARAAFPAARRRSPGALEHYSQFLIGRDPSQIGALWQEMYRSQYFEGGRVLQAAISAIDIALYDIKGKALGVPVYQLLGGKQRDLIPTFASTSAPPGAEMIEQAKELVANGWIAMRLSPAHHGSGGKHPGIYEPRESIAATAKWMVKAREELGDLPVLGIDYHHRLSVARSRQLLPEECRLAPSISLKSRSATRTPEAYESLRTLTDVPFAIGEEFASKWAIPALHRARHPPVQPHRRLQCRRAHRVDEGRWLERGPLRRHDAAQPAGTGLHGRHRALFGGRVANFSWLETRTSTAEQLGFDNSEFFPVQPRIENAHYRVSDAPGLGVEVNEELIKQQSFKFWEAPHLKRHDGSVTNW